MRSHFLRQGLSHNLHPAHLAALVHPAPRRGSRSCLTQPLAQGSHSSVHACMHEFIRARVSSFSGLWCWTVWRKRAIPSKQMKTTTGSVCTTLPALQLTLTCDVSAQWRMSCGVDPNTELFKFHPLPTLSH